MDRIPRRARPTLAVQALSLLVASALLACAGGDGPGRKRAQTLDFEPEAFSAELRHRVPDIPDGLTVAPFVVPKELVRRARKRVMRRPRGPKRVEELVEFLQAAPPEGLGLRYDWAATGSAAQTLELGRGNCVSLASVFVGIGRGLGWPIYYAEARTRRPEEQNFEEITALSDHMVVVIVPETFSLIVDFTGLLDKVEDLRLIDDVNAYAHVVNNRAAHSLMHIDRSANASEWRAAANGFRLATRIEPDLGRAWNNLGIALSRLERFDEARAAYERALALDTAFGSAERNLTVMETRLLGEATIRAADPPGDIASPPRSPERPVP